MDETITHSHKMKLAVLFVAMCFFATAPWSGALECYCDSCQNFSCTGDICFARVTRVLSGHDSDIVRHIYHCMTYAEQYLCNTSSTIHATLCCQDADDCNLHLVPMLAGSTSTQGSIPVSPLLRPDNPVTSAQPDDGEDTTLSTQIYQPPPTPSNRDSCFESDTENGNGIRLCNLVSTCYTTIRRASNGTVLRIKRGCSITPCMPEYRNRKIKTCCSSSLCNTINETLISASETPPTASTTPQPPLSTSSPLTSSTPLTPFTSTPYRPPIINPGHTMTDPEDNPTPPTPFYYCSCSTLDCPQFFCNSTFGCFTNVTVQGTIRGCIRTASDCVHATCCVSESFCNGPPSPGPPTMAATDPMHPSTPASIDNHSSVTTHASTTTVPSSRTKNHPQPTNTEIYYVIGTVIVVLLSIVAGLLVIGCAVCFHRRSSSKRKAGIVATLNNTDSSKDTLKQITIVRDESPSSSPTTDSHASSLTPMNPKCGTSV